MLCTYFRARSTLVTLIALMGCSGVARADIAPEVCEVDNFKRYLGEECVRCETGASAPDSCRAQYEPRGLKQRCYTGRGDSSWTELWCGVGAAALAEKVEKGAVAVAGEALPGEVVAVPEVAVAEVPVAIAPGEVVKPEAAAAPGSVGVAAPVATAVEASAGCGCASGGTSAPWLVVCGLLLRRRRVRDRGARSASTSRSRDAPRWAGRHAGDCEVATMR